MIYINNEPFYEEPTSCGTCTFFNNGRTELSTAVSSKGHCRLWNEMHHSYINPPRRCGKIFRSAFKYPEGARLVIVRKDNE